MAGSRASAPANTPAATSGSAPADNITLTGNAYLANGVTYGPCCGTPPDTTNTFVAFGGGNQQSGFASADFAANSGHDVFFARSIHASNSCLVKGFTCAPAFL